MSNFVKETPDFVLKEADFMKNFKKIIQIAKILLCLTALLLLSSCGGDEAFAIITENDGVYESEYEILYGADGKEAAESLSAAFSEKYGISLPCKSDSNANGELKIFVNSRGSDGAAALSNKIDAEYPKDIFYAWGYSFDGKSLFVYCNNSTYAQDALIKLLSSVMTDGGMKIPDGTYVISYKRISEYKEEQSAKEELEIAEAQKIRFDIALDKNTAFTNPEDGDYLGAFGGGITMEPSLSAGSDYPVPSVTPMPNAHPRVNINSSVLKKIKTLGDKQESAYTKVCELAEIEFYGEYGAEYSLALGLSVIEAKAMMYLLTERPVYAYEALVGIKNTLLSAQGGEESILLTAARVYDWCYPMLTARDKEQIVSGAEHLLCKTESLPFPPSELNNGGVSAELCAYLAFACAIYDEYPDWWRLCAGIFYYELPLDNAKLKLGLSSLGVSEYAPRKLGECLLASHIIKSLGAEHPYADELAGTVEFAFGYMMPNGKLLPVGDCKSSDGASLEIYSECALMTAALFGDASAEAYARELTDNYTSFSGSCEPLMTSAFLLILLAELPEGEEASPYRLPEIQYIPYDESVIARRTYDGFSAMVFMKIGASVGGADKHRDAGTFQIYYKGLLAGCGGSFEGESAHTEHYHRATASKCGLLIYDPDITDGVNYGGQETEGEVRNIVTEDYMTEDGVGYIYGAADYTELYSGADFAERRMLTLFGDNSDMPIMHFVFDSAVSENENAVKSFLLQVKEEPELKDTDGDGFYETVNVCSEGGRLTLTSVLGAEEIKKIGDGEQYFLGGEDLSPAGQGDGMWGRVEVRAQGSRASSMLNMICVTDTEIGDAPAPKPIEGDGYIGAQIEQNVAIFVNNNLQNELNLNIDSCSSEDAECFVSGVGAGTWCVSVNGTPYARIRALKDGSLIHFSVPAGEISLVKTE